MWGNKMPHIFNFFYHDKKDNNHIFINPLF